MNQDTKSLSKDEYSLVLSIIRTMTPNVQKLIKTIEKKNDEASFLKYLGVILQLYNSIYTELSTLEPGALRAQTIHRWLDREIALHDLSEVSCRAGCSACCKVLSKQITTDEAQLLAGLVTSQALEIDWKSHKTDSPENPSQLAHNPLKSCMFLDQNGACKAYDSRPNVCRKLLVTSNPTLCTTSPLTATSIPMLVPELITSVSSQLSENQVGAFEQMVTTEIQRTKELNQK